MSKRSKQKAPVTVAPPPQSATRRETRQVPMMSRLAPVGTVDNESRTAEVTWTTGADVRRYDWRRERYYLERLIVGPENVRMGRLSSGRAPLLNTHSSWDLSAVMGVVDTATLERASIRFSRRPEVEPFYQDVLDGIIRNISVGYDIHRVRMVAPSVDGGDWIYEIVDWEPYELSLVPMGADAGAGVRDGDPAARRGEAPEGRLHDCVFEGPDEPPASAATRSPPTSAAADINREVRMTEEEKKAAEAAEKARREAEEKTRRESEEKAKREAREAEATRQREIRELCSGARMSAEFTNGLLGNVDTTVEAAGLAILREQAQRSAASPSRSQRAPDVQAGRDERDTRFERVGNALRLRANPSVRLAANDGDHRTAVEAAREFRGLTLIDMAREAIELAGGNTRGLSRHDIAAAAMNQDREAQFRAGMHGTSDFPELLANTVGRTLRAAYQLSERTFVPWTRRATAPDFKQIARVQLSDLEKFKKVNEGGEYKYLSIGDAAEKYSLGKYGGIIAITWETIINDDLSGFDRLPTAMAAEAAALEADIVYGIILDNAAMADGTALFHADHGNLLGAAAIAEASLGLSRAAMFKQTGPKGRVLNLRPKFLLAGPDTESAANRFTSASFVAAKSSDINPNFNTNLTVISEARITGTKWFQVADPSLIDTVEYAYLEGEEGLFTETKQGFDMDGVMVKARHVFAAKAIDHRGMTYNPGA